MAIFDKTRHQSAFVYRRLLAYVNHYWLIFFAAIIANALCSAVDAGMVKLLQPIIDDVFVARDEGLVAIMPILLPIAFLIRGIMSFLSEYGMSWIARRVVMRLRAQLFCHFQRLPADFYHETTTGQLLSKLTFNIEQVAKAATDVVIDMIRHVFLSIFLLGVMFWTSWRLTLLFLIIGPIVGLSFAYVGRRFRRISHRIQDAMADIMHIAEENIENYQVVRTFNAQTYEVAQFNKAASANRQQEMKMIVTRALSAPIIQFLGGIALALTLYFATAHAGPNSLTAGGFATLMTAMIAIQNPIKQLASMSNKFQQGLAGAESIFAILDEPTEQETGDIELRTVSGDIRFEHVDFAYRNETQDVLKNISLHVRAGETVALVGPSGGGKTTLLQLLPRFYDNYRGTILLDGQDIRAFTLQSLRHQIAYVSQHVTLFNDTIANNIAYGRVDEVAHDTIIQAAEHANALAFIEALPDGFDTIVGENGVRLSGGQRQRLAIARAICKNAPILILDEATSALDTQSERAIQGALEQLMVNKTTIIIAHRLSTIEKADKIVVIKAGMIREQGTHRDLLSAGGVYASLHRAQPESLS